MKTCLNDELLLKLCDYFKWEKPHLPSRLCGWTESRTGTCMLSDPFQDLNAVHEAESRLLLRQQTAYLAALVEITDSTEFLLLHATAPQRVEALVRAITVEP